MQLEYYVVRPRQKVCEAVVSYDIIDPIDGSTVTQTKTVTLDQVEDLKDNPSYTDNDVASAISAKHAISVTVAEPEAIPVDISPAPAPAEVAPKGE